MASTIKVKRSAIAGKSPTTGNLEVGEIALNTKDGRLYSKGTMVFEVGANNHSLFVGTGGATFANGAYTLPTADGSADQILKTNGSGTLSFADSGTTSLPFFVGGSSVSTIPISSGVVPFFDSDGNADNIGASADFVTDATPQLGGNLDLNSRDITGTGNITITGNYTGTGNITNTGNFDLISTDAGSAAAPELTLYRNSSSPADSDYLGQLRFEGENDAGQNQLYAKITGKIGDASDGTEDGILEIAHVKAGSQNISARFTSSTLKLLNGTTLELKGQDSDTRYANNTVFNSALANTNAYIATTAATERSSLANTNAFIAATAATERSSLANTNAFIAATAATERSSLANTNAYIATTAATERSSLANTNAFIATKVAQSGANNSAKIPYGTTGQRDGSPDTGFFRYNVTTASAEIYDGSAWGEVGGGGGATGGGNDQVFYENGQTVTTNYTISSSTNAMATGPITINSGVAVTVPTGGRLVII